MKTRRRDWRTEARIVWAIFAKDLREVIRNKNTISVLVSALFIVGVYRMLPSITRGVEPMRVWVYDQGQSGLAAFLENSTAFEAEAGVESLEKVEELLRESDVPELGLVVPADFDDSLEAGEDVALQGYRMSWLSPQDAAELTQTVEDEIARLLGRRVPILTEGNVLDLLPDSSGPGLQAALAAVFMLTMIGTYLVPQLIMAEKQQRTLDILLVSPASETHVAIAKALTGMVYCSIGGAISLALNQSIIVHWWLAVLGVAVFSCLSVAMGLALGTKVETRAQLSLWSWVIFIPMFIPAILVLLEGLVPKGIIHVARFMPTVAFCIVWRYSFAQPISPWIPVGWLVYMLLWTGAVMGLVIWLMGRSRHQAEGRLSARPQPDRADVTAEAESRPVARDGARASADGLQLTRPILGSVIRAPRSGLRILWAIVAKDLREALSNRILLSILIGSGLVILNGAALPLLLEMQRKPAAVVYDEGRSTLIRGLMLEDDIRIRLADSREEFDETITTGPGTWLGLILPADFDQRAGDPAGISLEGHVAHWASEQDVRGYTSLFEEQLTLAAWTPVEIDLEGGELYPTAQAGGQIALNLMTVIIAMTAIGIALVPLLIVEEKESHTLDALLVSPAQLTEVVLGKALVGGAYCLLSVAVGLLFNAAYIVHWEIVLLAALLSVAFAAGLGTLVGVLADNPTSAWFWGTPILLIVIAPTVAQFFMNESWPAFVRELVPWSPGAVMINLFRLSVARQVPGNLLWANVAALAGVAAVIYLLAGWRIRRLSR